jgi:hypothetical protein
VRIVRNVPGVDQDLDPVLVRCLVPLAGLAIEHELVLKPAASAPYDFHAEARALAAVARLELLNLLRSGFCDRDYGHLFS